MLNLTINTQSFGNTSKQTINARDLHQQLQVGKVFAAWITDRIQTYGFIEGEEFFPNLEKTSGILGGRPKTEYFITLDMAKELALLENNPTGRQVRRQLIEAERQLREDVPALLRKMQQQNNKLKNHLFSAIPEYSDIQRYYEAGLTQKEMGKLLDKSDTAVRETMKKMALIGLINYKPNPRLSVAGRLGALNANKNREVCHA